MTQAASPHRKEGNGTGNVVIMRAFIANLGIAIAKFFGAATTGSSAMLSEGIHSLVDTINEILLMHGEKRARRPADALHPLGYGRELYFWTFVVAELILALGAGLALYEGFSSWAHPHETESPTVALAILGVAFLFEGWSLIAAIRKFNAYRGDNGVWEAIKSIADTSTLSVLLEDSAAVTGLVIAAAGIGLEMATGDARWDAAASILIGVLLAVVAVILTIKLKSLLIGQTADPRIASRLEALAQECPDISRVHEVIAIQQSAEEIIAVIGVDFADGINAAQVEGIVQDLTRKARENVAGLARVYVSPVDI